MDNTIKPTLRQQLEDKLRVLNAKFETEMRGRMIGTPKAMKIRAAAIAVQAEIDRLDREAAEELAFCKAPLDEALQVIMIPLLADVMNAVVADVNGMLLKRGCGQTVFGQCTATIQRTALKMVDALAASEAGLPKLLDVDDMVVDTVRKKLLSFIKQRLNITKK